MREERTGPSGVERLAALIKELDNTPLSDKTARAARLCLLDTLGVGLYGSTQPEAEMLLNAVRPLGSGHVGVWGTDTTLEAGNAALVCGSLCHLRELDDVHYAILHTGCVCVPALMAAAEGTSATLGDLLRSIVNGVEVMARISFGMDYMEHRELGWHGTATCGAFGAAASAGYLLGLNQDQLSDALGIAGSRTGGTWAFAADGSMSKRLHPGLAARDGLMAAYLAKAGISGPHLVLEAVDGGFYRLFTSEWDIERVLAAGERPEVENVEFKWFASCKSVHSPITAALQIRGEHPDKHPDEIERIRVEVNRSAVSMAGNQYDEDSVVSAQISIPYGVALGLLGREGLAEDYSFESLRDPAIRRIADLVEIEESEEFNHIREVEHLSGARVTVYWKDGSTGAAKITRPKGALGNPLSEQDVLDKFLGLASAAIGEEQAGQLLRLIMDGEESLPAEALTALLRPQK